MLVAMRARDLMQRHFVGVSRTTTVASALKLASSAKVDLMPVLDGQRLCGLAITADLELHRDASAQVDAVMRNPVYVNAESDVSSATGVMIEHGIARVPVVEDKISMICVGMLTSTDIVNASKKR